MFRVAEVRVRALSATQFTWFTSRKVQILTPEWQVRQGAERCLSAIYECGGKGAHVTCCSVAGSVAVRTLLALLVQRYNADT